MENLKLFKEVQSCQDCLFSWEGYAHGFFRSHSVLEKDGRIVFAADDLSYLVPYDEHIEIETQLKQYGWHELETCPKCKSRNLFPLEYNQKSMVEVQCFTVGKSDLVNTGKLWRLSASALEKIA